MSDEQSHAVENFPIVKALRALDHMQIAYLLLKDAGAQSAADAVARAISVLDPSKYPNVEV
ncbi:hypothetical protein [Sphingomonas sp. VNH70]|jgi:hypothetical protein|uniref:hypothetical protein n=1 Tax=Sphingomonas silueang TaxID=3156617 RepID=UPI0032B4D85E